MCRSLVARLLRWVQFFARLMYGPLSTSAVLVFITTACCATIVLSDAPRSTHPIIRIRGAAGAVARLAQPLVKTSNLRGFASCPLRSDGGASRTPEQTLLPRVSCRHATSTSQQGQTAGVDPSQVSDDRSAKDCENCTIIRRKSLINEDMDLCCI